MEMNLKTLQMLTRRPRPNASRLGAFLAEGSPEPRRHTSRHSHDGVCFRCGGAGWFDCFRHVEGGICFRCRGNGVDPGEGKPDRMNQSEKAAYRKAQAAVDMGVINAQEAERDRYKDAMYDPNWEKGMKAAQERREALRAPAPAETSRELREAENGLHMEPETDDELASELACEARFVADAEESRDE